MALGLLPYWHPHSWLINALFSNMNSLASGTFCHLYWCHTHYCCSWSFQFCSMMTPLSSVWIRIISILLYYCPFRRLLLHMYFASYHVAFCVPPSLPSSHNHIFHIIHFTILEILLDWSCGWWLAKASLPFMHDISACVFCHMPSVIIFISPFMACDVIFISWCSRGCAWVVMPFQ